MSEPFPITTVFEQVGAEDIMHTFAEYLKFYREAPEQARQWTEQMRAQAEPMNEHKG